MLYRQPEQINLSLNNLMSNYLVVPVHISAFVVYLLLSCFKDGRKVEMCCNWIHSKT